MAPKRRHGNSKRPGNFKRKKLNLFTVKQKNDFRQFGESHPIESEVKDVKYTKVSDDTDGAVPDVSEESSSSENEEDVPIMQQLMSEIGAKEDEPESEQDSDEDNSSSDHDDYSEQEQEIEQVDDESDEENEHKDIEDFLEKEESHNNDDFFSDTKKSDVDTDDDKEEQSDNEDEIDAEESGDEDGNASASDDDKVNEEENAEENLDTSGKESDPFTIHFETERDIAQIVEENPKWNKQQLKIPGLGSSTLMFRDPTCLPDMITHSDLKKSHVKQQLCNQLKSTVKKHCSAALESDDGLSSFQHRLFCAFNSYQDLLFPKETMENANEIRVAYCLHALNHILKTRSRVVAHNAKLKKPGKQDEDVEYRDQGLTRPKVLIILPYRGRALKVVNILINLLSDKQVKVSNRKRFESEYSEMEAKEMTGKGYKSADYFQRFEGNLDDNFRLGMNVSKKSLRLYSPFYESDIIVASPLGLRTVIGEEGDKEKDFDFLSSIEVLIMDEADVFTMQNWDHMTHIMKHLHLQPKESHGVDFSRVRMWSIDGLSKYFRQTLMFSHVLLPEFQNIFNKHCHNYTGKVLIHKKVKIGTISNCLSDSPQIFHRISCDSPNGISQRKAKLDYLMKKIVPYQTSSGMTQTLVFCNYFSFVMLRNHFRESETRFLFINEYDDEKHIRKMRVKFRKTSPHFLLYTERLHYHYRFRLRGIFHIVWFDLPQYPAFYSELVNLMETSKQACTSTCLFTKFDAQRLMEIVGESRGVHMINSPKAINMIAMT